MLTSSACSMNSAHWDGEDLACLGLMLFIVFGHNDLKDGENKSENLWTKTAYMLERKALLWYKDR